jgi:Peptidase family M23
MGSFVRKLFRSVRGGLTVYEFDPQSAYCYYYAHLDRYAEGLREGAVLKRGNRVGNVGSTGDASPLYPHLHFATMLGLKLGGGFDGLFNVLWKVHRNKIVGGM